MPTCAAELENNPPRDERASTALEVSALSGSPATACALSVASRQLPASAASYSASDRPRVLSLACVYPNPNEPNLGIFVRSRLQHLLEFAHVRVVAPVALLDYANAHKKWRGAQGIPSERQDGAIQVSHPSWLFPPLGPALNTLLLYWQIVGTIRRVSVDYPFDLIDAHFAFPDGIAAAFLAARFHRPFFVTLRGNETLHGRKPIVRMLMRWALRNAAGVITVSEALRQFVLRLGVPPERTRVIPNGVNARTFYPHPREECRAKHAVTPGRLMILSVGYLISRKGHHLVVRSLAELRRRGIDAELHIVGSGGREGACEATIRSTVKELGLPDVVRFVGQVPPAVLAELMSAADVHCLASSREGWPNVLHEAMACGTPVVTTAVGAANDLVPSKDYGFVVPVGDQPALTEALATALHKQWDRPAISAWAHARSWEQVAGEVRAFMDERLGVKTKASEMRVTS